ncbi:MAG: TRAP transporter substrate-binding protein DctP [Dehalococcoidia bacterium]|nr:TRAP transporter substrate-binding protein DctP [Dehalococcoidia bacterium]
MRLRNGLLAGVMTVTLLLTLGLGCAAQPGTDTEDGTADGEKITWTLDTYFPAGLYLADGVQDFCDGVNTRAGGGFVIEPVFGSALGVSGPDVANALGAGTFEADYTAFPYLSTDMPVMGIMGLPMLCKNNYEGFMADFVLQPYYRSELATRNIVQPGGLWSFPKQMVWSKKPINTVADFAGTTFRAGSAEATLLMDKLGADVISMAQPEVYTALQRGMLDAILGSTATAIGVSAWEVLDYGIDLTVSLGGSGLLINQDAWNELPAKYQVIVTEEASRVAADLNKKAMTQGEAGWQQLISKGIERINPDPSVAEEIAVLAAPIWDQWSQQKGGVAAQALAELRAVLGR